VKEKEQWMKKEISDGRDQKNKQMICIAEYDYGRIRRDFLSKNHKLQSYEKFPRIPNLFTHRQAPLML